MPSKSRKDQLKDSLVYHLLNRGNGRKDVYHSIEDYQYFITLLKKYSDRYKGKIYHWVLMSNHYHFLIEIQEPEMLSRMMAGLSRAYAHYYHRRYNWSGYLWQGRFRSQAIEKEQYLLACGRYIERNPVKAKIVDEAEMYIYSSARYYINGIEDGITTEDPYFEFLSGSLDKVERRQRYREFLRESNEEEEKLFRGAEFSQGGEYFLSRLIREKGRVIPRRRGRIRK